MSYFEIYVLIALTSPDKPGQLPCQSGRQESISPAPFLESISWQPL